MSGPSHSCPAAVWAALVAAAGPILRRRGPVTEPGHRPRPVVLSRVTLLSVLILVVASAGCSRPPVVPGGGPVDPVSVPSDAADQPTPTGGSGIDPDWPRPHLTFARTFTDPLYYDGGEEFSPFGSDEGADSFAEWSDRRSELDHCTTVRALIESDDPAGALQHPEGNGPDVDGFIISAGFALIYLTGHIDTQGKQLTLDALRRTYAYYADDNPREQPVMIRDLEAFAAADC